MRPHTPLSVGVASLLVMSPETGNTLRTNHALRTEDLRVLEELRADLVTQQHATDAPATVSLKEPQRRGGNGHRRSQPKGHEASLRGTMDQPMSRVPSKLDDGLGHAAPRLAQSRPGPEALAALWEQFRLVVLTLAEDGFAHGDLSPYNLLVTASNELVVIDLPQLVDVTVNPQGIEFLHRDVMNVSRWFVARGAAEGGEELFAEALARLY